MDELTKDIISGIGDITWSDEEKYEWWADYLKKRQAIENRISELDDYIKGCLE